MLEQLARQYAEMRGTNLLASRIEGEMIIFVLESGQKYSMNAEELQAALQDAAPAPSADAEPAPAPPLADAPQAERKPKKERKRG